MLTTGTRVPFGLFLVYYFRLPDYIRCDPEGALLDGTKDAGRLFKSLEEAEAYAKSSANHSSRVGAGIYDQSGKIIAQYLSEDFSNKSAKAGSPPRLFLWAALLLFSGCAIIWIELRYAGIVLLGFLIGGRLIFSGIIKLFMGIHKLRS